MTILGYYVALIVGVGIGAIGVDFLASRRIAELEAENEELRLTHALAEADDFDDAVAKLKAVLSEPDHAA